MSTLELRTMQTRRNRHCSEQVQLETCSVPGNRALQYTALHVPDCDAYPEYEALRRLTILEVILERFLVLVDLHIVVLYLSSSSSLSA